jgi:hypothetical protein
MEARDRIANNEKLQGTLARISELFERADREAVATALASNDTSALASALKVSPEALPDIINAFREAAGDLLDLPEVKAAARLLSESD